MGRRKAIAVITRSRHAALHGAVDAISLSLDVLRLLNASDAPMTVEAIRAKIPGRAPEGVQILLPLCLDFLIASGSVVQIGTLYQPAGRVTGVLPAEKARELLTSKAQRKVYDALLDSPVPLDAQQVASRVGSSARTLQTLCKRMWELGYLKRDVEGERVVRYSARNPVMLTAHTFPPVGVAKTSILDVYEQVRAAGTKGLLFGEIVRVKRVSAMLTLLRLVVGKRVKISRTGRYVATDVKAPLLLCDPKLGQIAEVLLKAKEPMQYTQIASRTGHHERTVHYILRAHEGEHFERVGTRWQVKADAREKVVALCEQFRVETLRG